jgi:ATP phosphoribosyltransferase regulatory subunit HisZ
VKSGKVDKRCAFAFFKVFSHQDEVSAFFDLPQDILIFSEKISCKKLFNLSESAEKDYYTGVIFGIFLNKKRIGFGGKYSILKKEGIGFSINLLDIFS